MMGRHNSVLSRVKEKQPNVFSIGCVIDDFFVDLYYYFEKSTKRKEMHHEFEEFTDTKVLKIIKQMKTRWLSLDK